MSSALVGKPDGSAFDHWWCFIDDTARACCITDKNQWVLYIGDKRVHVLFICWFLENPWCFLFKPKWKKCTKSWLITNVPHLNLWIFNWNTFWNWPVCTRIILLYMKRWIEYICFNNHNLLKKYYLQLSFIEIKCHPNAELRRRRFVKYFWGLIDNNACVK